MRIYTDRNGVEVQALNTAGASDGPDGLTYRVVMGAAWLPVNFQVGPVKEFGVNGLSTEALLVVCKHRLTVLNDGRFRCFQNAKAIAAITDALTQLEDRAQERERRGVLGTSEE